MTTIINNDALTALKTIDTDSIDVVATDPPYGYSFMNKDWDKAVIGVEVWKEVLRVLKPGAFAAIMSSPRQDVLSRMIANLQTAGFRTDFTSIYWTYASGFPKAANVSKLVDKRNGRDQETYKPFADYLKTQRKQKGLSQNQIDEKLGTNTAYSWWEGRLSGIQLPTKHYYLQLKQILDLDKRFDELIKREEAEREIIGKSKTGYSEILGNKIEGKGNGLGNEVLKYDITKPATEKAKELDGSYAGFQPKPAVEVILMVMKPLTEKTFVDQALANGKGITWLDNCKLNQRFPANLLVSDSVLKDHSKYFDLDKWFDTTFPFIITPKASSTEKNKGLDKWIKPDEQQEAFRYTKMVRKTEPSKGVISSYLKQWRENKGLSQKDVAKHFPSVTGGLTGCVWNWENYANIPTKEEWLKLKQLLGFDDKYDKIMTEYVEESLSRWGGEWGEPMKHGTKRYYHMTANSHPTVKPLKLMTYLISLLSKEQDTILDPFCGSGTTLIAAKMLNRKYIGIELNPEYVDIANKRLMSVL